MAKEKKKRSEINQERKRKALLEAAIKVFSQKGFHGATISEIASEAKVADGTTYLYFKNKDDLLIKSVENLFDRKMEEMAASINEETTGLAKLLRFAEEHIRIFTKDRKVMRFLAVELRQSKEFYKKYPHFKPLRKYLSYLQEICEEAIEEGTIRNINSTALSYIIFGTINFVITEWAVNKESFSLEEVKDYILDILRDGVIVKEK